MKVKLQKLIGTAVLGLALVSHSLPAWAGSVGLPEVTTTHPVFGTLGTMAGARYSTDSVQYIGCQLFQYVRSVRCVFSDGPERQILFVY